MFTNISDRYVFTENWTDNTTVWLWL